MFIVNGTWSDAHPHGDETKENKLNTQIIFEICIEFANMHSVCFHYTLRLEYFLHYFKWQKSDSINTNTYNMKKYTR